MQVRLCDAHTIPDSEPKLSASKGSIERNAKSPSGIGLYAGLGGKGWLLSWGNWANNLLRATQIRHKHKLVAAISST